MRLSHNAFLWITHVYKSAFLIRPDCFMDSLGTCHKLEDCGTMQAYIHLTNMIRHIVADVYLYRYCSTCSSVQGCLNL